MDKFLTVYADHVSGLCDGAELKESFNLDDDHVVRVYSTKDGEGEVQISLPVMEERILEDLTELGPVKTEKQPYRIAFLMESFFIGNSSGVYTFLRHFITMCEESDIHLDILLDQKSVRDKPADLKSDNVSIFIHENDIHNPEGYFCFTEKYESLVRADVFERTFKDYLDQFTPDMVVAHSMPTTQALHNMSDLFKEKGIKRLSYTHIGDVMDANNIEMLDFRSEVIVKYIQLFEEIDFPVGTQTESSKEALDKIAPGGEYVVLPEPYYTPADTYIPTGGTSGVLIIASNYSRKRFDLMFEVLAITGLPVTVVCGLDTLDGVTLRQMANDAGVQGYRQLSNMPNKYLPGIIKQHRVMLHLSEAEVMPYAILEASESIPCIVNGTAPWAAGELPCPVIKVDPEDVYGCVSTILEAYGDTYEYKTFDTKVYSENCEEKWKGFLDG